MAARPRYSLSKCQEGAMMIRRQWWPTARISRNRLIFGVGRSGFRRTYEAYCVPYGECRERFAETLEILRRA